MRIERLFKANLSLFDGEGAAQTGSADGTGEANNNNAVVAGQQSGAAIRTDATEKKTDAGSKDEGGVPITSNTLDARRAEYQKLIGEYKDLYEADTQKILNRRFKEFKTLQQKNDEAKPIMEMLMGRYGVEDAAALQEALESDEDYWQQAAYDAGMDVPQYMEFNRLKRENKAFVEAQAEREGMEKANKQLAEWNLQAEAVKQKFPNFNLEEEIQNEDFVRLLGNHIPIEHAYKILHFDELMNDQITKTQASAESRVVENIRANGQRPIEAGLNSQNAISSHVDVSKLNKKQRAEIAKRAARGESITF